MFVTNHVLSGALIGRSMRRRPVGAFLFGVGSHLVLDAVPHWGCDTEVPGGAERFLRAARRDGVAGLAAMAVVAVTTERGARPATVAAMAGAVLLDLDKPVTHFFGVDPFPAAVTRLHRSVQNESPSGMPNELVFAAASAATYAVVTGLARRRRSPSGPAQPVRPAR